MRAVVPGAGSRSMRNRNCGRHQRIRDRELQALFRRVAGLLRLVVDRHQVRNFGLGRGAAVSVVSECGQNALHAGGPVAGSQSNTFFWNRMRFGRRIRSADFKRLGKDIAVRIGQRPLAQIFDEIVIQKFRAETCVRSPSERPGLLRRCRCVLPPCRFTSLIRTSTSTVFTGLPSTDICRRYRLRRSRSDSRSD